jgi:pyruvate,water dikinase
MKRLIIPFEEVGIKDVSLVGGKNASLGEMYANLTPAGINIPDGFATTADAYWEFINSNNLKLSLDEALASLDIQNFSNLHDVGSRCRKLMMSGSLPEALKKEILEGYHKLITKYGKDTSLAVRSSATAEDLPNASFAGQQETFLNVKGDENLMLACQRCFASLFTDRAIKYRIDNGFQHMKVALSIGVQLMVRSDLACSGVMFTLEPDTGFENVVFISGAWGLGENVVQGTVNTDEFMLFKPLLSKASRSVISKRLGSKGKMMIYSKDSTQTLTKPEDAIQNIATPDELKDRFVVNDDDLTKLAQWAGIIQKHYGRHMDIEWAKDGNSDALFIVQARPETVHSNRSNKEFFQEFSIKTKAEPVCSGIGLGHRIISGKARVLHSAAQIDQLQQGEILVTERTDPDWDPILKKASAIITEQGGRTSHAAIVARELGAVAIVGTGNATQAIKDGQIITVSTAEGDTGFVYVGKLDWDVKQTDLSHLKKTKTKAMLILGHPDKAFIYSYLPNDGVGLMRMEFIISNAISVHPMALKHFEKVTDNKIKSRIEWLTRSYTDKTKYFIERLAEATATIAAAFYPKDVIVRMSDFKSNEYANLLGGKFFEPHEENPMIGLRGASRYYHPLYQEAFEMECKAMKMVREEMGFSNVKLMVPFCRTLKEADKVLQTMKQFGLERNVKGLEIYVMIEIPSNALLAKEYAKRFDGFSIGSNDLTQLTLGADRDSELLGDIFSPFDPAVMELIQMTLEKANEAGIKCGLCGQAPSDYPEYAKFLVDHGIQSISFNPDALIKGIENIALAEESKIVNLQYQ